MDIKFFVGQIARAESLRMNGKINPYNTAAWNRFVVKYATAAALFHIAHEYFIVELNKAEQTPMFCEAPYSVAGQLYEYMNWSITVQVAVKMSILTASS